MGSSAAGDEMTTNRRCRPRQRTPGGLRPTDVVGAFFVLGLLFAVCGLAVAIANSLAEIPYGRWLALHLVFVGGISQLVLGASQFFAGAALATDPPPRLLVRVQVAGWNLGAIGLAVAVPTSFDALTAVAVGVLLGSLATYAAGLRAMRRRSLRRYPWATRWYVAGAAFLGAGICAGLALAWPIRWPSGDLLAAHMSLNLAGWFGAAIVGTLHTFYPSLTQTELRFPRLQGWTWAGWVAGVTSLAAGYGWGIDAVAAAGWLALSAAAILLAVNILGSLQAAAAPLSLPARIVGMAQAFLVLGLVLATATALADGPGEALAGSNRAISATALVLGWIGLTVLGSLLRLLAVLLRVRDFSRSIPEPRPARDRLVATIAGIGVIGACLAQRDGLDQLAPLALGAVLIGYGVIAAQVLVLAAGVLHSARPRL
jgi:nitrite reductase (NO-forming)